jgi:hypothetical protein
VLGALQVRVTCDAEVAVALMLAGAVSRPAVASAYVPEPVAEK